jgi:hypothetical protein
MTRFGLPIPTFPITNRYLELELSLSSTGKESKPPCKVWILVSIRVADCSTDRTSGLQYRGYFNKATVEGGPASNVCELIGRKLVDPALFMRAPVPTHASRA